MTTATATRSFREDGLFYNPQNFEAHSTQLSDDLLYVLVLSYQMMKKSLMGFAIFGIPFWVVTVGFLSVL